MKRYLYKNIKLYQHYDGYEMRYRDGIKEFSLGFQVGTKKLAYLVAKYQVDCMNKEYIEKNCICRQERKHHSVKK